jgi:predicted amidohydrolase YtcJ
MNTEYILKSRKVITLDEERPYADWVHVKGGRIERVGSGDPDPEHEILDLGDAVVLPGLMDSHVHGCMSAIMLSGVNLIEVTKLDDVLVMIEEECAKTDKDLVIAAFFIQPQVEEGRYPTIEELDRVSHGKRVMVASITLHGGAINTAALKAADIPPALAGGLVMKDGKFTGEINEDDTQFYVMSKLLYDLGSHEIERYIDLFGKMCVECGLTSVHCLEGMFIKDDIDMDIWQRKLSPGGDFPIHGVLYPQVWDYDSAQKYGLPRHGGCLTLDGADMDYTMALDDPYAGRPELRGFLYHRDRDVYDVVSKAHRDGKQTAFHAMGDRAIDQILHIIRQVTLEQGDKDLRHRIEHFTMPRWEHVEMARELGVVVNYQPEYTYLFDTPGGPVEEWFGPERALRMEQYRVVSDYGVAVTGGSDSPVNSLAPLTGIHALVNTGREERRFDVTGALKLYTKNVAYAAFEENERGTIKEGFHADFTALAEDPYEAPGKINEIKVVATVSEGDVVYRA